jgi:hypothetical protein
MIPASRFERGSGAGGNSVDAVALVTLTGVSSLLASDFDLV